MCHNTLITTFYYSFCTSNKENTVGSKATISTVPDPVLTDCSSHVDGRYLYITVLGVPDPDLTDCSSRVDSNYL